MSPRKSTKSNYEQVTQGKQRKAGVQAFGDFVSDDLHVRFDEMDGQTIYIVKLEIKPSEKYGTGYKVHFKDLPNAADTQTASVFGEFPVKQLDQLYKNSHDGKLISLTSPVMTTIEKVGRSYKFK